jgi:hypothetical protein
MSHKFTNKQIWTAAAADSCKIRIYATDRVGNRLTDGGAVVNLMSRLSITPRKVPGAHFC